MTDQKQELQKVNPIKALEKSIAEAKNVKDLLSIPAIHNRYVKNYEMGTGRHDGEARYERDLFSYIEKVNNNAELLECDPFSHFAAFVKIGTYGVSPDKIYLQPQGVKQKDGSYKKVVKVSTDPFAKKELLERMPTILRVGDPMLVFNADTFKVDPKNKKVLKHEQEFPQPKASEETIKAVYLTVDWAGGYSTEYWLSLEELKTRRSKSKMNGGGALWQEHFGEAAKKSVINYLFKAEYKAPETQMLFPQYEQAVVADEEPTDADVIPEVVSDSSDVPEDKFDGNVNEQTGEVYEKAVSEKPDADKKKKKKGDEEPFI